MNMTPVLSPSHNGSRKLHIDDILDLRAYEKVRVAEKARVMELKRKRRVELGTILTVLFENRDTMWNLHRYIFNHSDGQGIDDYH